MEHLTELLPDYNWLRVLAISGSSFLLIFAAEIGSVQKSVSIP